MTTRSKETINPKALSAARNKQGFSQQDLAAAISNQPGKNISAKTIYRYENGKGEPSSKRAQWLAAALHTTIEDLRKDPADNNSETSLRDEGYVQIRRWLSPDVFMNYRLAAYHYGVSITDLVNAAPWMLTLLAEKSLVDRANHVAAAFKPLAYGLGDVLGQRSNGMMDDGNAFTLLPKHLRHGKTGDEFMDALDFFTTACTDEMKSISERDIFGKILIERADIENEAVLEKIGREEQLFTTFLRQKASDIKSKEIDPDDIDIGYTDDPWWPANQLPRWPVFTNWFYKLTGGDWLAEQAIKRGHAEFGDVPQELREEEKRAERVAWLIAQIPDHERTQLAKESEQRAVQRRRIATGDEPAGEE